MLLFTGFIEVNSTEFYVMALTLAMACVAILFGQRDPGPSTTVIVPMDLNDCVTDDESLLVMKGLDDGAVLILRNALPVTDGDTVHLVITATGNRLTVVEKYGRQDRAGLQHQADGTAYVERLPHERFTVRYESELTGQWALFTFSNRPGNTATTHLKY